MKSNMILQKVLNQRRGTGLIDDYCQLATCSSLNGRNATAAELHPHCFGRGFPLKSRAEIVPSIIMIKHEINSCSFALRERRNESTNSPSTMNSLFASRMRDFLPSPFFLIFFFSPKKPQMVSSRLW